ncbi:MAG: PEP-CTERM sorting domain-containing protein [Cyanobacteria bacterium P01_G01_bin.54]
MKQFALTGLAAVSLTLAMGAAAEAFTITLDGQWYEISARMANTSPRTSPDPLGSLALLEAQPWYGSEELAQSAATQVAAQMGPETLFIENLPEFGPPPCSWDCNGDNSVFFAWDVFDEELFIDDGNPNGPTSLGSYRMEWISTFSSSDANDALGIPPVFSTEKIFASDYVYAVAEAVDAPETVPEPGTLVGLAALGLLGVATRKRS